MKKLTLKTALAILALAISPTLFAQNPAEKYYGFESGQVSTDSAQKKSAGWWLQANDLFSINDNQNHTNGGSRAIMYKNKKKNKAQAIFCGTYDVAGAPIILGAGEYKAECWIYLEKGEVSDFTVQFAVSKFKDGKYIPEYKAKDITPDYESPFRAARFNTKGVKQGEWVKVETPWPFALNGETEVESINSILHIQYPAGAPAATFYIDDIRIFKVE